jgi:hypothetical protein
MLKTLKYQTKLLNPEAPVQGEIEEWTKSVYVCFAVSGGLVSYGFIQIEPFRRAASYALKF